MKIKIALFFLLINLPYHSFSYSMKKDSVKVTHNFVGIQYSKLPAVDQVEESFYTELTKPIKNYKIGLMYGRSILQDISTTIYFGLNVSYGQLEYEYIHSPFHGVYLNNIHFLTRYDLFYLDIQTCINYKIVQSRSNSFYLNSRILLSGFYRTRVTSINLETGEKGSSEINDFNNLPHALTGKYVNSVFISGGIGTDFKLLNDKYIYLILYLDYNLSNEKYFNREYSLNNFGYSLIINYKF